MTPATGTPMLQEAPSSHLEAVSQNGPSIAPETSFASILQDAAEPVPQQIEVLPAGLTADTSKSETTGKTATLAGQFRTVSEKTFSNQPSKLESGVAAKTSATISVSGVAANIPVAPNLAESVEDPLGAPLIPVSAQTNLPQDASSPLSGVEAVLPGQTAQSVGSVNVASRDGQLAAKPQKDGVAVGDTKSSKEPKGSKGAHGSGDATGISNESVASAIAPDSSVNLESKAPTVIAVSDVVSPVNSLKASVTSAPPSSQRSAPKAAAAPPSIGNPPLEKGHAVIAEATVGPEKDAGLTDLSAAIAEPGKQPSVRDVDEVSLIASLGISVAVVHSSLSTAAVPPAARPSNEMVHETGVSQTGTGAPGSLPMTMLAASPTSLEVGVSSGTHGWLKIRAELAGPGEVNASLSPASPAAAGQLREQIPALASYLQAEKIHVGELTVQAVLHTAGPQQTPGSPETLAGGQGSSSGLGGGGREGAASQQYADDARRVLPGEDERQQREHPLRYEQGTGLSGDRNIPLAEYGSAGAWLNVRA